MSYISMDHVVKRYHMGEVTITAVNNITFDIERGEFVVIVGPSGAGKTTVLNILGGMDSCTSGSILVDGQQISAYTPKQLTAYRRYDIGFVFQFYNLVQNLTALENVELATQICKSPLPAADVLAHVGLQDRLSNFPAQLSGGEQQRVALARALTNNANLIIALIAIVLTWFFLYKTKWGLSIRLIGANPNYARYIGINVFAMCVLAQFIGGALSGFGGGMEMFGRNPRFAWFSLTNLGWDGIMVATLARYKPQYVLFSALFLGYVRTGADIMNRSSDVASEIVMIIQAVMILFIGANAFLARTQQKLRVKYNTQKAKEA